MISFSGFYYLLFFLCILPSQTSINHSHLKMKKSLIYLVFLIIGLSFGSCKKWSETGIGSIRLVLNPGGQNLGYDTASGVKLITTNGLAFKDLNKNGKLDIYEDWRLPVDERAKDLASKMSVEQIAGLMLYSPHQSIPFVGIVEGKFTSEYKGKPYAESGAKASDLTDNQIKFITNDNVRHVLMTSVESPEVAATWNNNMQALCEGIGLGIPANNSSDPRNGTVSNAVYNVGSGGIISMWPGPLGLAATFDPAVVKQFGQVAAREYRALGITTALSPQVDLATEPRWARVNGTFGENVLLSTDMARAYVDGFQTSVGDKIISGGWGYTSVNAMVKHWPGGGTGEGGRDAHCAYGKYAVYPGNNLSLQIKPFIEGALKLDGETKMVSGVMPYYTISYKQNKNGENVGNNYNSYLINDLLRGTYGYDGVVCTDWGVTWDKTAIDGFCTTSYGVEELTPAQRHYKAIMIGVDQFGGNSDAIPVIEAYNIGVKESGEKLMRSRFEQSAVRLLKNFFRLGLFENPYLNVEETKNTVGSAEFMKAGYEAQLKSIVMLKNRNKTLPVQKNKKVYIPVRNTPAGFDLWNTPIPAISGCPVDINIVKKYFNVTENPAEADFALVFISSPNYSRGWDMDDVKKGGNGYVPISLQYSPYKAILARDTSIAGGDPLEKFTNRSYKGKSITTSNASDLKMVLDAKKVMKGKPVVVSISMSNPMVFSEFEKEVDAILVTFDVQEQAIMDMLSGTSEPSGLMPLQMPADMKTVEEQFEDVPYDIICHVDSEGNTYDFGFGLNWNGVIKDARVAKYKKAEK